ncbi:MAG: hypothetical protein JWP81_2438 [Ferruginibacter sp.]|nr:hypothetical protein [Ferruginibacter sp.]
MKQKFFLAACLTFSVIFTGWSQVSIGTNTPDPSAQFEVHSNNKGFLPPRIALSATNLAAPVSNPVSGLLVYNTATAGNSPTNVAPGYYYWDGSSWYPVATKGVSSGDIPYWNGNRWSIIPVGADGSVLTLSGGVPTWGTKEQILTEKIWKVDRLHHVISGSYSSYTNGGVNTTGIPYDNLRFTFNADGTGTHTNELNLTYTTTWQFTTSDKRTLLLTVNAPTTFTNTWEMVEISGNYLHASTRITISGNSNNLETFRLIQIP